MNFAQNFAAKLINQIVEIYESFSAHFFKTILQLMKIKFVNSNFK